MSILSKAKAIGDIKRDGVVVIYGPPGSGKTTSASTFPKPMLIIDILEGGTDSIGIKNREGIEVLPINNYSDFDMLMQELVNQPTQKYKTIVIDSVTNLEFLMKEHVKKVSNKSSMTLQLWGLASENNEKIYNFLKMLHKKTDSWVVAVAHEKELKDDDNPKFNKLIPSLMTKAANSLAAKASFVWYTKIETENRVDKETGKVVEESKFFTYIDAYPYLVTKTRKPQGMKIPGRVSNLTFGRFKKGILDEIDKNIADLQKASIKKAGKEEAVNEKPKSTGNTNRTGKTTKAVTKGNDTTRAKETDENLFE